MEDPFQSVFQGMMEQGHIGSLKNLARSKKKRKGEPDRRIIRRFVKDGREHYLHATKGWRTRRV